MSRVTPKYKQEREDNSALWKQIARDHFHNKMKNMALVAGIEETSMQRFYAYMQQHGVLTEHELARMHVLASTYNNNSGIQVDISDIALNNVISSLIDQLCAAVARQRSVPRNAVTLTVSIAIKNVD